MVDMIPNRRVLASPDIEDEIKVKLKNQYAMPVSYTHLTLPTICSV